MSIATPSDAFNWHDWEKRPPPEGKLVLIWRLQRKKYAIARYEKRGADEDDSREHFWITQYGLMHGCEVGDVWTPFLYYSTANTYD